MAVKKYKKTTPLTEEVIVDMIINWKLGEDLDSDSDSVDEEPGELRLKPQPKLKNKIILRRKNEESEGMAEVKVKLTELEEIFTTTSNDMERQHITLYTLSKEQGLGSLDQIKDWAMKHNNFLRIGHKSGIK
ncbi:hypothetical protein RhiirA4_466504 [Rhizophagus irregularis]|uniref:Uncharacterized protein n=1 Tax=Rhizophagus irregularis TaxID=588596 RepID=A0A2I1GU52_9GLOM|nr:hypothetical protein RhiirA4_466504 [Rhizophagus irregularis]